MRHSIRLLAIPLMAVSVGCNTLQHSEAKHQAHLHWSQVRGRIKYQLAQQRFESGRFDESVRTVRESIALDPNQAAAYAMLAKSNLELGKAASAQQALDTATRLGLGSADLTYMQGVLFEQRNKLEAALAAYSTAREADPTNADYLVAHAECLVALDRAEPALRILYDNLTRVDDDGTLSALAAHITKLLGNSEEATRLYAAALVSGADSRLVARELGGLLTRAKRYAEALAVLLPLIESEDDGEVSGAVRRAVATCHLALNAPAAAKGVLIAYAADHPEDTLAQLLLGKAAVASNDIITALRAVDLVGQRRPNHPELWLLRATVQWKRGNLDAAASDLYDILQNDPDDVDAHCLLAEILRSRQHVDTARTHFETALKIDPHCAWAAAGLAGLKKADRTPPVDVGPRLTSAGAKQPSLPAQR